MINKNDTLLNKGKEQEAAMDEGRGQEAQDQNENSRMFRGSNVNYQEA
jgi:hypothetical protein